MVTTKRRASRARQYHKDDLEGDLRAAAVRLIRARGVAGWSLRDTARVCGVSHTAVYRHYADKASLIRAVATSGFEKLTADLHGLMERLDDNPLEMFRLAGVHYAVFAHAHPSHFRVMFGPESAERGSSASLDQASARLQEVMHMIVGACQRSGAVRRDESEREIALSAWAAVHGLAALIVGGHFGELTREEVSRLGTTVTHSVYRGFASEEARLARSLY